MHQEKAQNIMGAFAYQINNCEHCGKPANDLVVPPPVLDTSKLEEEVEQCANLETQVEK
jgi:hypothetical protein